MTEMLKKAFEEASGLPDSEQNRIAAWLIQELRDEHQRDKLFADSAVKLEELAGRALTSHSKEKSQPLGTDSR